MLDYIYTLLSKDTQINMLKHALYSHDFALEDVLKKKIVIDDLEQLDPYIEKSIHKKSNELTVEDYIILSLNKNPTIRNKALEQVNQFTLFGTLEKQAQSIAQDLQKKAKILKKDSFFDLYCSYTSFEQDQLQEEILNYLQENKEHIITIFNDIAQKTGLEEKESNKNLAFENYFKFKNKKIRIDQIKKLIEDIALVMDFACTFAMIDKKDYFIFFKNKKDRNFVVGLELKVGQHHPLCEVKVKEKNSEQFGIAKIILQAKEEGALDFFEIEKLIYDLLIVLDKNSQKKPDHYEFINLPQYYLLASLIDENFIKNLGWNDATEIASQYSQFRQVKNYKDAVFVLGLINFWKDRKNNKNGTLKNNVEGIVKTFCPHSWLNFQIYDYQVEKYWELHYIFSKIQADKLFFKYPDFKNRMSYYHLILKKYFATIPMNIFMKKFINE